MFGIMSVPCQAETPSWLKPVHMSALAQQGESISVSPVRYGELHALLPAMASVMANSTHSVMIRPAGSGKVTEVLVTPGARVRKGQVLMTYTDHSLHELYLEQGQTNAALSSARAAVSEAEKAYQRGRSLSGTTVSSGEVLRRLAMLQQAQATLAAKRADSETIKHRLEEEFTSATETIGHGEDSRLISPVDGVVQNVGVAVADDVTSGDVVANVTDLSSVWIVASIRPEDAQDLVIGGRFSVRPSGHMKQPPVFAKISTINDVADADTGLLRVIGTFDRPAVNLRPGTMLDATLETAQAAKGIIVPATAIQQFNGHDVVYTPSGGTLFQPHDVHILLSTDDEAVVQSDLPPDSKVVSSGSFALKSAAIFSASSGD
ncbi:efflux RND transporter periplasmic adaptor subunit [Gluconobacter cerinus]|nr:efflux RND transporter periplasmic adaptor subunit [Gluconobacter cerinus]MBS1038662.1 efflux RND transporter periplasmic adaptor subunit [Gluconobacter cerinus]MBS1044963.1 efflux RND transporter periplasmic adaptor subunit [Gluconobacter cerinus]